MTARIAKAPVLVCCLVISLNIFAVPVSAQDPAAPASDEQRMTNALQAFGFALPGTISKVAQSVAGSPDVSATDARTAIQKTAAAYKTAKAGATGIAVAGDGFRETQTGVDATTDGTSMVSTLGVLWVKRQSVDALSNQIANDARAILAQGVQKVVQVQGLDYASLQKASSAQMKTVLLQVPAFQSMETSLANNPEAQSIFESAAFDLIANTSLTDLGQAAPAQGDPQKDLLGLSLALPQYVDNSTTTLTGIGDLKTVDQKLSDATDAIADLTEQTDINARDLARTESFLFSQASAKQKKQMLDMGFLSDLQDSNPNAYDALKKQTDAAAHRDELVGDMKSAVQKFDDIGKIAKNLNIDIPGMGEALTIADTAETVVSDISDGNFLGAVVGITGLFGSHTDPLAAFQKQLFNYLGNQFKKIDSELSTIIDGEKQILTGLATLSKQMAEYDQGVQDHLDRLGYDIENVEKTSQENFYWPLANCRNLQQAIVDALNKQGINPPNLTQFDQAQTAANADSDGSAAYCTNYLRNLYGVAFAPTSFGFDPLALRYLHTVAPTDVYVVKTDANKVNQYESSIQTFMNGQYQPVFDFFTGAISAANPFGSKPALPAGLSLTTAVSSAAIPAQSTTDFGIKIAALAQPAKACAQGSLLLEPLVNVLCKDPNNPNFPTQTRIGLPASSPKTIEDNALTIASTIMREPLVQDSLVELANWAEFFAPLSDYTNPATGKVFNDFNAFVSAPQVGNKGESLIRGALQTLTFGIAQGDMLYGDVTANLIFNLFWNDTSGFTLPAMPSDLQKKALAILQSGNPYLQENVLMFALDRASLVSSSGQQFAYNQAIDLMTNFEFEPDSQLNVLFQDKLKFTNIWRPLKLTSDKAAADQSAQDCEKSHGTKVCMKVPAATVLGIDIPLPSSDDFSARKLIYPRFLLTMLGTRDRMAAHLADYEAFNTAVAQDSDPAGTKAKIARTVILAYQ